MKDFNYYAPTEVMFGENSEEQVAALVKKYGGTKVLVHYGGKSAERSGIREMTRKCSRDYKETCGAFKVLTADDMEAIYRMAR